LFEFEFYRLFVDTNPPYFTASWEYTVLNFYWKAIKTKQK